MLENNYIAVHIRRTDFHFKPFIPDTFFITFINEHLKNHNLYIATDNKDSYDVFKEIYNDRVKCNYHTIKKKIRDKD